MTTKNRQLGKKTKLKRRFSIHLIHTEGDSFGYALLLAEMLETFDISVSILAGDYQKSEIWHTGITQLLHEAEIIVILYSPRAQPSSWVEFATAFAIKSKIPFIPIVFENTPREYFPQELFGRLWVIEEALSPNSMPSAKVIDAIVQTASTFHPSFKPKGRSIKIIRNTRPLNEGKIILVGRGEVGKTSIVKRLVEKNFCGDEAKTQGINITTWAIKTGNDKFKVNIWDFGGQEIMHATHQFFLTERSLYLLVLNGREGGEDIDVEYWMKHIETFGGNSNVIVVQNKISEHHFDLNYRGLQSRYPQICSFIKTDCKNEIGIEQLYTKILEVVTSMPEVRMQFPLDWFRVKNKLEQNSHDFISYDNFLSLCKKERVEKSSDIDTLSLILHCLGIILNYREDIRLRETSVLKPEWVTDGIYKILNSPEISQRQGELDVKDLELLLDPDRYPSGKHQFLLELMRKFSLCFAFPDDSNRYLIAELLGKEEPEEASQFPATDCLNFEYHYSILPEGLLPRFIVRSHILSQDQRRWRTGVILSYEGIKAVVQSDLANRRVTIRVRGGNSDLRRQLLAIIRYDWDKLHAEFKDKLDIQAKIPITTHPQFAVDYKKLIAFDEKGLTEFPEYIENQVINIQVKELLTGVDFSAQREKISQLMNTKSLFISYSHKDEPFREDLETHLKLLQRQGKISVWHDRKIGAGREWSGEIDQNLETANIIILLISADFIASDYCWEKELSRALERHESGNAIVIPIMIRPCDRQETPFNKLQGLPKDMKPLSEWENKDAGWTDVAKGLRSVADTGNFSQKTSN